MRNTIIRIIVFSICFVGGCYLMNAILGGHAGDLSMEMDQATLPVVYTSVAGQNVNCMHGYTSDVNEAMLRQCVTPLEGKESVKLIFNTNGYEIKKVRYEVRSSDSTSLVEDGKLSGFEKTKSGDLSTTLNIRMQLKEGQEYILKLIMSGSGGVDVNYYTRIVFAQNMHTEKQLKYVTQFSDVLFNKSKAESIQQYLEYDPTKTSNNLGKVDITSDFEAITYGQMKPQKVFEPTPVITSISEDVACMKLAFVVSSKSTEENMEYFLVEETYKVRYTDTRMYLLSYDRTMNSFYDKTFTSTSTNSLKLGISNNTDIPYVLSDNCKRAAFVKNRELYYFNYQKSELTKVFSFLGDDYGNRMDLYDQHDIKVIQMNKAGDISFAVYGYMNRGRHEGENGILFCQYKAEDNQVEEIAFVPSKQPFSVLCEDVNEVIYLHGKDIYVTLSNHLYHISMPGQNVEMVQDNITNATAASSADHQLMALVKEQGNAIEVTDLQTQKKQVIQSPDQDVMRVLGFVGHDLVYGLVHENDVVKHKNKQDVYPVYKVNIMDQNQNVSKQYEPSKSNEYVMGATVKNDLVELSLASRTGNSFKSRGSDWIMSNEEDSKKTVELEYVYNTVRYKELFMKFPDYIYVSSVPELVVAKEKRLDENRNVNIEEEVSTVLEYYVYENGTVLQTCDDLRSAVAKADEVGGTVVNNLQVTVWEASGVLDYATVGDSISMVSAEQAKDSKYACAVMILAYEGKPVALAQVKQAGKDVDEILTQYISKQGINLTGCTLQEVMYYICQGHPVIAKKADGNYVLLTSFNASLLKYYDPVTGNIERIAFSKMEEEFSQAGNVYFSY